MNQSEQPSHKCYLTHSNRNRTLINLHKLNLIRNFLFLGLILISVEGIAQSTIKSQNKTSCTIQFEITFYDGANPVYVTPALQPLSVTTITIPNGYYFCTLKADYPGGVTPDIVRSSDLGTCNAFSTNPNNCHSGVNQSNLGGGNWDFSFY